MNKKKERISDDVIDQILAGLANNYESAGPEVRGAVIVAASESADGFLGFSINPLKPEVYSRAKAVLNTWILEQLGPAEESSDD